MENEGILNLSEITTQHSRTISTFTILATAIDFWSHNAENGRAILENRAIIDHVPLIGKIVAGSIGNFGYSAAGGIGFTLAGEIMWEFGDIFQQELVKTISKYMPIIGIVAVTFANVGRELIDLIKKGNSQITPDIAFGLAGVLMATAAVSGTFSRLRHIQINNYEAQGDIGMM